MRRIWLGALTIVLGFSLGTMAHAGEKTKPITPLNGKDLTGWKLRGNNEKNNKWQVGKAAMDEKSPKKLTFKPATGPDAEMVNVVTGVFLFIKNAATWGTAIPFGVKMLLVVLSVVLLLPIRKYVDSSEAGELDGKARLLAIASILAWTGAVTAGRLLAYLVV